MICKWVRNSFLIAISFFLVGIVFSCKHENDDATKGITFKVTPEEAGEIIATVNASPIKSGDVLEEGSEVIFRLVAKGNYTIDEWVGAKEDKRDRMKARLIVSGSAIVEAKMKTTNDPELKLESLNMYRRGVNITNLEDVKIEVENYVKTLSSSDVVATFTYGTQTTGREISVKVDKELLKEGENSVRLSVPPDEGKYRSWNQMVTIIRKEAKTPDFVQPVVRLNGIDVAMLTAKKSSGKYKYDDYISIENFESDAAGPYVVASDAKTAYVAVRVKVQKPSNGDYTVKLTNTTTYIQPLSFSRLSGDEDAYLKVEKVPLSKGRNVLEIEVKSPNSTDVGKYVVIVNYDGGPDPVALKMSERKMLPIVYLAAQRKPLEGENEDAVWLICMAGWCGHCGAALIVAGNGGHVQDKYRGKGLRVIALDVDGQRKELSEAKWKKAGANFCLYDAAGGEANFNCFGKFSNAPHFPYNSTIRNGRAITTDFGYPNADSVISGDFGF